MIIVSVKKLNIILFSFNEITDNMPQIDRNLVI